VTGDPGGVLEQGLVAPATSPAVPHLSQLGFRAWGCPVGSSVGCTCWTGAGLALSSGRRFWVMPGPEAMAEAGLGAGDPSCPAVAWQ